MDEMQWTCLKENIYVTLWWAECQNVQPDLILKPDLSSLDVGYIEQHLL